MSAPLCDVEGIWNESQEQSSGSFWSVIEQGGPCYSHSHVMNEIRGIVNMDQLNREGGPFQTNCHPGFLHAYDIPAGIDSDYEQTASLELHTNTDRPQMLLFRTEDGAFPEAFQQHSELGFFSSETHGLAVNDRSQGPGTVDTSNVQGPIAHQFNCNIAGQLDCYGLNDRDKLDGSSGPENPRNGPFYGNGNLFNLPATGEVYYPDQMSCPQGLPSTATPFSNYLNVRPIMNLVSASHLAK